MVVSSTPQLLAEDLSKPPALSAVKQSGVAALVGAIETEPQRRAQPSRRVSARRDAEMLRKGEEAMQMGLRGTRRESVNHLRQQNNLSASLSGRQVDVLLEGGETEAIVDEEVWRAELRAGRDRMVELLLPYASAVDDLDRLRKPAGFAGDGGVVDVAAENYVMEVQQATESLDRLLERFTSGANARVHALLSFEEASRERAMDVPMISPELIGIRVDEIIRGGEEASVAVLRGSLKELTGRLSTAYRKGCATLRDRIEATTRLSEENDALAAQIFELELSIARLGVDRSAMEEEMRHVESLAKVSASEGRMVREQLSAGRAAHLQLTGVVHEQRTRAEAAETLAQTQALRAAEALAEVEAAAAAERGKLRRELAAIQSDIGEKAGGLADAVSQERAAKATIGAELAEVQAALEEERRLRREAEGRVESLERRATAAEEEAAKLSASMEAPAASLPRCEPHAAREDGRSGEGLEEALAAMAALAAAEQRAEGLLEDQARLSDALATSDRALHEARQELAQRTSELQAAHKLADDASERATGSTDEQASSLASRVAALEVNLQDSQSRAAAAEAEASALVQQAAALRHQPPAVTSTSTADAEALGVLAAALHVEHADLAWRSLRRLARLTEVAAAQLEMEEAARERDRETDRLRRKTAEAEAALVAARNELDEMTQRVKELQAAVERSGKIAVKASREAATFKKKASEADQILKDAAASPSEKAALGEVDVGELLVANKLQASLLARREAEAQHAEEALRESEAEVDALTTAAGALARELRTIDDAPAAAEKCAEELEHATELAASWRAVASGEVLLSILRLRALEAELQPADEPVTRAAIAVVQKAVLVQNNRVRQRLLLPDEVLYMDSADGADCLTENPLPLAEMSLHPDAPPSAATAHESLLRRERARVTRAVAALLSGIQRSTVAARREESSTTRSPEVTKPTVTEAMQSVPATARSIPAEVAANALKRVRAAFPNGEWLAGPSSSGQDGAALLCQLATFVEVNAAALHTSRDQALASTKAENAAAPPAPAAAEFKQPGLPARKKAVPVVTEASQLEPQPRLDPPAFEELSHNSEASAMLAEWRSELQNRLAREAGRAKLAAGLASRLSSQLGSYSNSASFQTLSRILASLAAGELPPADAESRSDTPPKGAARTDGRDAAVDSAASRPATTRPHSVSKAAHAPTQSPPAGPGEPTRHGGVVRRPGSTAQYTRSGAGQLALTLPTTEETVFAATDLRPIRSPARPIDLRRSASPERSPDARPLRSEPVAKTMDGRIVQERARWAARERHLKQQRAEATENIMAHYGAITYSGAIFAQLHSLLDAARSESEGLETTPNATALPPIRHILEGSSSAPLLLLRPASPSATATTPRRA